MLLDHSVPSQLGLLEQRALLVLQVSSVFVTELLGDGHKLAEGGHQLESVYLFRETTKRKSMGHTVAEDGHKLGLLCLLRTKEEKHGSQSFLRLHYFPCIDC